MQRCQQTRGGPDGGGLQGASPCPTTTAMRPVSKQAQSIAGARAVASTGARSIGG